MTLRKPRRKMIIISVLLFMFGNISLIFEMGLVDESINRRKLNMQSNASHNVSVFQHYPLDIDLKHVVDEVILYNKSIIYTQINPYSYRYLHSAIPCDFTRARDERSTILIVVKSHVLHTNQRLAIRHVWKDVRDSHVRLVFLLGTYSLDGEQWRVEKEVKLYGDIVQGNFIDNYNHITYKVLMGLDWINRQCTQAELLLFLDDDFYVYPTKMLLYLRSLSNHNQTFIGKVNNHQHIKNSSTIRKRLKLKHVSFNEIPTYVNSGSYVMSQDTARKFYTAFPFVKYFEIDAIYLGIIAQKLDVRPQHDVRFDTSNPQALAFECSHYAPRLLRGDCPLAGRRRDYLSVVPSVTAKVDTFWVRLQLLPRIMKSAAKQIVHAFVK
ncbi:beta-1,3-galactosyltransferase brn-like [Ylistrum balloti]|uniref:beta-1,3-galactosyltransferase brn-like n=1 Tax=Ylistrum balloti TaxID=509963 RepID=UPI0029059A05|nr:beta-1,3-galactosyltransferase brn-like [Ylistrum balloti]